MICIFKRSPICWFLNIFSRSLKNFQLFAYFIGIYIKFEYKNPSILAPLDLVDIASYVVTSASSKWNMGEIFGWPLHLYNYIHHKTNKKFPSKVSNIQYCNNIFVEISGHGLWLKLVCTISHNPIANFFDQRVVVAWYIIDHYSKKYSRQKEGACILFFLS